MSFLKNVFFLAVLISFTSCSVSKHLADDARVITKTKIEIANPKIVHNLKNTENEAYAITQPKPATGFSKWQTNVYNKQSKKVKRDSTGREKGIRGWIIREIGIQPVYFDSRKIISSRFRLKKYFNDDGYFGTTIQVDTFLKKKEVTVKYRILPKRQYSIRNIHLPSDSLKLVKDIFTPEQKSLLVEGASYSQTDLTEERQRLAEVANNSGYINVNKDHFYFFVDTALGSHQADVYLRIRQPKDSSIFETYHLDQNIVFASYSLSIKGAKNDTTVIDKYKIVQQRNIIRPKILVDVIGGEEGELYSTKSQNDVLTRLLDLGIYKFVNLKIEQVYKDSSYLFNREFYLTPGLMHDVAAEFEALSRSTSYFGFATTVTYSHKNIFRGAERLDVSFSGAIGTQSNTTDNLINILDGAVEVSLTLPRLITPFKFKNNKRAFIPKTRISIGNDYQRNLEYYTVNSFIVKYGYDWSKKKLRQHQFFPINVNLFVVQDITDAMRELFVDNPRLEKSFSDVFILGLFYNYTISTQTLNPTKSYLYLRTSFEASGNVAYLIMNNLNNQQQKPYKIAGSPFSQFVRTDVDLRYYIPFQKENLVTRFFGGIGIPYGNSEVLPYIRQYSVGGPSSIRAFQFRGLGPGSYIPPQQENNNFIEQTGDIRLEGNVEYRFPIVGYFKGALFVDAGNIWLLKGGEDDLDDGIFEFNTFYKQIAVGTGFGLRFDLNFLVVRLDLAFPLRKPYLDEGERWVFSEINFFNSSWRNENLQWNFAIGYPF